MEKVIIYSTPICTYCKDVKDFLAENSVEFVEKDITKDREALLRMKEISKQMSVPVLEIGDEVIVGFEPDKMQDILSL